MKTALAFLPTALLALSGLAAAPPATPPSPAGHWEGVIERPDPLQVRVDLTAADGGWKGTIDIPQQGAEGIPLEKITVDGSAVRFTIAGAPGSPTFEGSFAEGVIRGTFTRFSGTRLALPFPFHLGREALPPLPRPQEPKPPLPYTAEDVTYQNGSVRFAGTLTTPPGAGPFPAVVLITDIDPQNRDAELSGHKPFLVLADHLTRAGIAVLRADDRGVGGSTGSPSDATASDLAGDALAAVRFLKSHPRVAHDRIGLLGHGEGGLVASRAAGSPAGVGEVAFLVLLASPGVLGRDILPARLEATDRAAGMTPEKSRAAAELMRATLDLTKGEKDPLALRARLRQHFAPQARALDPTVLARLGGPEKFIDSLVQAFSKPGFLDRLDDDPRPALSQVRVPVLAVNGALDCQVPVEQSLPAIEKALRDGGNKDVTARSLPGLNHLFQTAKTGGPYEYASIEETMSPLLLDAVTAWIVERFGKPAATGTPR